jgi:hypothetical protein
VLWRAPAFGVALLCVVPFYRLLTPESNGPGGADALLRAEASWSVTLWGALVVTLVGAIGFLWARGRPSRPGASVIDALLSRLAARSPLEMAVIAGAIAGLLSGAIAFGVYGRQLVGVDEMAQVIHARFWAAGELGGSLPAPAEAWTIPNMIVSERGWTSQYPPGHPLVLAAFELVRLRWVAGPVLFALMIGLLSASLDRLLSEDERARGRIAVLLMSVSPYALTIAASSASHLTAGAAGVLALHAALRASDAGPGRRPWAAVAGAAVGLMVLARPWTGLVLGPALTLGVWLERGGVTFAARALVPWAAGGLPSALALLILDDATFGSPFVLGYEALYGPAHGLGLHTDPWSYPYGLREALAYSSSDLVQLGATLLEAPVSVVLLGAAYLALARSLPRGVGLVAAWALLPVAANALYWFHAPRMLFEASSAWMLLAVLAVFRALERAAPDARAGIGAAAAAALLIALPLSIARVASERWDEETLSRIAVPDGAEGALVFVHTAWDERVASMLQAAGMRNDSIQPILRRNDTCALHLYAVRRLESASAGTSPDLPGIDLTQTHEPPVRATPVALEGGTRIWREADRSWPDVCVREAATDRLGAVALAPLLWQGDLPGLESGGPLFVRDYGPERNRAVLTAFPDRRPLVFGYEPLGTRPVLAPYDRAMAVLWGAAQPVN